MSDGRREMTFYRLGLALSSACGTIILRACNHCMGIGWHFVPKGYGTTKQMCRHDTVRREMVG